MKVFRASPKPLVSSNLAFAECDEPVICVAPTADNAAGWKDNLPIWELEAKDTYLIEGKQLVPAGGRWIECGDGLKEAFVRPSEVTEHRRIK